MVGRQQLLSHGRGTIGRLLKHNNRIVRMGQSRDVEKIGSICPRKWIPYV